MPLRLIIFDMDDTLVDNDYYVFKQIKPLLEHLKKNNIRLAIASFNKRADKVLKARKMSHYFDFISGSSEYTKDINIKKVLQYYKKNKLYSDHERRLFIQGKPLKGKGTASGTAKSTKKKAQQPYCRKDGKFTFMDILFVDNNRTNVIDVNKYGIPSIKVDPDIGFTLRDLAQGVHKLQTIRKKIKYQ